MARAALKETAAELQRMDDAVDDLPDPTLEAACPAGWFSVDDDDSPAPDNGKACWLTTGVGGPVAEGYFRHSRRRAKSNGLWEEFAYWATVNGGGTPVPFVPRYWRPSNALVA